MAFQLSPRDTTTNTHTNSKPNPKVITMGDPAASILALMASWFTSSSLFIFVNLAIITIAITSRFGASKKQPHDSPQLIRSPSLLDRVRSFNLGHYNHCEPTLAETECTHPQLVRTRSLLERVKSFNFGFYKHEPTNAETEYAPPDQHEFENPCPNPDNPQEPQLARAPSLLQRLQSMKFSRLYRSDSIHGGEKEPEPQTEGPECEEDDEETVERRRPATARSERTWLREEDEEVDAKADDFINGFKKQLRLQRIDSILRYRELLKGN